MTRTASCGRSSGRRTSRAWFSAPAFLAVLPAVCRTRTPYPAAISAVRSVQLSQMTTISSGTRVWTSRDSIVAAICPSSSWEGTATTSFWAVGVPVSGPVAAAPRTAVALLSAGRHQHGCLHISGPLDGAGGDLPEGISGAAEVTQSDEPPGSGG